VATWSDLHPDVLPYVPGCPDPVLDQETRQAAIEFFRRTRVWTEWLEPIYAAANLREYDLDLPAGSEVVRIEQATRNESPFEIEGFRYVSADPAQSPQSGPLTLTTSDRVTVSLSQPVGAADRIQLRVSLAPSRSSTGIADTLFSQHRQALAEGARHRLLRMPGPLHKPREAEEARLLFERAVAAASVDGWRGHTNVTPRARPKWC
jgi:hypothetical protein